MRKFVAGALMLAALGGCHSIFGHSAKLDIQPIGSDQTIVAAVALEEGRAQLRAGNPGLAIILLQKAASDASTIADAHNALGVAYAMVGRGDLAERYFQKAMAENPAEPKYAANLARYYSSREAALARASKPDAPAVETVIPLASAAPVERTMQAGPGVVRVSTPARNVAVTRVSQREVAIRTANAEPVPDAAGRRRNPAYQAAATTPAKAPAYPIRIELASVERNR